MPSGYVIPTELIDNRDQGGANVKVSGPDRSEKDLSGEQKDWRRTPCAVRENEFLLQFTFIMTPTRTDADRSASYSATCERARHSLSGVVH